MSKARARFETGPSVLGKVWDRSKCPRQDLEWVQVAQARFGTGPIVPGKVAAGLDMDGLSERD